ncbi:MAG TPA: RsiV family protein [Flavisolibacter sp.]
MRKVYVLALLFAASATSAQISWYKQIDGAIGNYSVTVHLHKAGHTYTGYYDYASTQVPVHFTGDDTTVKGFINLTAFPSPDAVEFLTFALRDSVVSGSWKKETDPHPLPFKGKEASGLLLNYVHEEGEKKLLPQVTGSPQATYFAGSVWPTGATEQDNFLKKVLLQLYDEKAPMADIAVLMKQKKETFFQQYVADMKDVKPADFKEPSFVFNSDQTNRILLAYAKGNLATFAKFSYVYSGGAHGHYSTTFQSVNLAAKKKLTVSDILTATGQKQLSPLLSWALRSQFSLKPTDALSEVLFENRISPNNNFYITEKGIGFVYNPYEIAAYAVGEIHLFIPFKNLQNGLQPSFQKLLAALKRN